MKDMHQAREAAHTPVTRAKREATLARKRLLRAATAFEKAAAEADLAQANYEVIRESARALAAEAPPMTPEKRAQIRALLHMDDA